MILKNEYVIDLGGILRKKYPGIPGFMVRLVERLVHLDYINGFVGQGYEGVAFAGECLKYLKIDLSVDGLDNISPDGHYTFACNHPFGGADAIALVKIMGELFGENCRFPVNDFLMSIKSLSHMFIPVSKTGGRVQPRSMAVKMEEAFASDAQIGTFPAGKCSRKIKGRIQDDVWGKSFISKSIKYGRSIVPCRFFGQNSKRFYRWDRYGKLLRTSFPLAMVLLPDELYKAQGSTIRLSVGKPLPPEHFDSSKSPAEWAAFMRNLVYSME